MKLKKEVIGQKGKGFFVISVELLCRVYHLVQNIVMS